MSFFSSMFTRAKGAIVGGVSLIPIVGGVASRALERIHTGDEHQDAAGNWVNNADGMPTVGAPSAMLQAEIDRVDAFNAAEVARLRAAAAESAAKIGGALTMSVTNALDPSFLKRNALSLIAGATVVVLLIFVAAKKR